MLNRWDQNGACKRLAIFWLISSTTYFSMTADAHAQQCTAVREVIGSPSYEEDFGTGSGRVTHPNVLNHSFSASGQVQDDFYAVARSSDLSGAWMQTDAIGNVDADGSTNGRYLAINMRGKNEPSQTWLGEFFRVNNINLNPAAVSGHVLTGFRFSTSLAGTCLGCPDVPNFSLRIYDSSSGALLGQTTSSGVGVANDDIWKTAQLDVNSLSGTTSVDIVLFNSQPEGDDGNDVGVDNIFLAPRYCPNAPNIQLIKSANTSALSSTPVYGESIVYSFTVTNTGNVDLDQALTLPVDTMTYGVDGLASSVDTPMIVTRSPSSPDDNNGILEVGETIVFTGSFVLDQKSLDATGVHNTATTTGDPVQADGTPRTDLANVQDISDNDLTGNGIDGGPGGTSDDPTVVTLTSRPSLSMSKSADDNSLRAAGDVIQYTYIVTNNGNVTINNVTVNDVHNASGPAPVPSSEILSTDAAPLGDSVTFNGTYTVTQTDLDTLQ